MSYYNALMTSFSNPSLNRGGWSFEDDFATADNWTDNGGKHSVSGGALNWNATGDGNGDGVSADPLSGVISDTTWLVRLKFVVANLTSQVAAQTCFFGFSDGDHTVLFATAQDNIGFRSFVRDSLNDLRITWGEAQINDFNSTMHTPMAVETHFMETIRATATSASVEGFSDSGFSSSEFSKSVTIASTIVNLRFWKVLDGGVAATTSTLDGTIDDFQFNDGVTTPP